MVGRIVTQKNCDDKVNYGFQSNTDSNEEN